MSTTATTPEFQKQGFSVDGMTCTACASRIQKVLSKTEGVESVRVNFATETAGITWDPGRITEAELSQRVSKMGYSIKPAVNELLERKKEQLEKERKTNFKDRLLFGFSALLTLPLIAPMFYEPWMLAPLWQWILATPVQIFAGYRFYKGAYHSLKSGAGNMDVLVSLGTTVAYGFSVAQFFLPEPGHVYFESSAVILTLVLMGKILERRARSQATRAMEELLSLQPEEARVFEGQDSSRTELIDVRLIESGDQIIVLPGERVPLDGKIESGISETDDSLVTGESVPVAKSAGDEVFAGSLNLNGRLIISVSRAVNQSSVARIMHLVEEAQNSRAPVQSLVDRVSAVFVPTVVFIALLSSGLSYILGLGLSESIVRGVAVLVIACPCALGLASPIAVVIATGMSARNGILFRNAMALEISGRIKILFFDKTGTLTEGRPRVSAVHASQESSDVQHLLEVALAVEMGSEHPLSRAIQDYGEKQNIHPETAGLQYRTVAGAGIMATHQDGSEMVAGTEEYLNSLGITTEREDAPGSVVHVARNKKYLGRLILQDTIRPAAAKALEILKGMGIRSMILTGDRPEAASPIAQELAIDFRASLKPEEKLAAIDTGEGPNGMVGDGINDAPALGRADAGFAMGSGTDVASESADVTLMGNNPMELVDAIRLSRATIRKIYQNLFFAFIYNITGIPLAALGFLSPMIAGAAMALSSVSVVLSSLSLYRFRFSSQKSGGT
ncbi:MAG TPA: cadmium-translocating P-type ATPase [Leptospiraceae bacterium]|nr:heavy metal translocating P-type ATPase [Spirochaetaceae bacterium]HBS06869.1 cadmium-translocating P-type ATPase [Leptospiraceae bacterium]|tara:strand:- start:80284 stop:82479 length:2196 start_codon:yes stop_codon:yes gene_type:complete